MLQKKLLRNLLLKINPKLKNIIDKTNINLVNDGHIDSILIIKIIYEIENLTKTKIKLSKISKNDFKNINSIYKLFK